MLWLMIISGTETGSLTGLRCTGLACKYIVFTSVWLLML